MKNVTVELCSAGAIMPYEMCADLIWHMSYLGIDSITWFGDSRFHPLFGRLVQYAWFKGLTKKRRTDKDPFVSVIGDVYYGGIYYGNLSDASFSSISKLW